ncbi:MAG TPA: hypothetical protein PKM25_10485 [Candidatus Ozemobacteraceae bacterium]|nr:hypothetical protein [Candidatus Ozemobacteraceae bacterium]
MDAAFDDPARPCPEDPTDDPWILSWDQYTGNASGDASFTRLDKPDTMNSRYRGFAFQETICGNVPYSWL